MVDRQTLETKGAGEEGSPADMNDAARVQVGVYGLMELIIFDMRQ